MLTPRNLATFGLAFTLAGCCLLFCYGLPADVDTKGRSFITTSTIHPEEIAKGKRYLRRGRLGIALIGLGTALQTLALWV